MLLLEKNKQFKNIRLVFALTENIHTQTLLKNNAKSRLWCFFFTVLKKYKRTTTVVWGKWLHSHSLYVL